MTIHISKWSQAEHIADFINGKLDIVACDLRSECHEARNEYLRPTSKKEFAAWFFKHIEDEVAGIVRPSGVQYREKPLIDNPHYRPIRTISFEGCEDVIYNKEDMTRELVLQHIGEKYFQNRIMPVLTLINMMALNFEGANRATLTKIVEVLIDPKNTNKNFEPVELEWYKK